MFKMFSIYMHGAWCVCLFSSLTRASCTASFCKYMRTIVNIICDTCYLALCLVISVIIIVSW